MTLLTPAAVVVAVIAALLTAFQIALAAGAPWGRAAYGSAHAGVLPTHLRIVSAVAAVVWPLVGLCVLRGAEVGAGPGGPELIWAPFSGRALTIAVWVIVALLAVGTIAHLATPSRLERAIWAPATLVALLAAGYAALRAPWPIRLPAVHPGAAGSAHASGNSLVHPVRLRCRRPGRQLGAGLSAGLGRGAT